ncbi:MAG TPA: hydroxyacylglutathione hydrolase [Candidatus Binatia bacterium]
MKVVQVPCLKDNYAYLIICENTNKAAVVDPSESEPVLEKVRREGVDLVAILNTHHHWDHIGGNPGLLEQFSLEVFGGRVDKDRIHGLTRPLEEGDRVRVGELEAEILFIPGHTRGHIAYVFPKDLFCGDTLFVAGCGRLFEGTPEQMQGSLGKLKALPDDTRVHCGHEYTEANLQFAVTLEARNQKLATKLQWARALRAKGESTVPSTVEEERETNPFLRWDSLEIQQSLKQRFPGQSLDPVSVFARVRELKNSF